MAINAQQGLLIVIISKATCYNCYIVVHMNYIPSVLCTPSCKVFMATAKLI